MLTNSSEKFLTDINQNIFYREFTFDRNDFYTMAGNKVELADNVILLEEWMILIQIKERNVDEAKVSQVKWFENKVLKKAKQQIKQGLRMLNSEEQINVTNSLGLTINLRIADIRNIHNLIIYHLNEDPHPDVAGVKMYNCADGTFVHIISSIDYKYLCHFLMTLAEMNQYLDFRKRLLSQLIDKRVPEQYIFAHFLQCPDCLDFQPELLTACAALCQQLDDENSKISMQSFIAHLGSTLKVDDPNYRIIVRELAKMDRREIETFKERLLAVLESEPKALPFTLKRFASRRTDTGYVLMKLRRDQESNWVNALQNLTLQFKYKHRLSRCLGVIVMHTDADHMIDLNWAYAEGPWVYDQALEDLCRQEQEIYKS